MSEKSDALENALVELVNKNKGTSIPDNIPKWMKVEGIEPGALIDRAEGIGSKDKKNKTDVIIYLKESKPIKISAKLANADYFGNWYGHKRFLIEFGKDAFVRMTTVTTRWANQWAKTAKTPFVGVSVSFGKRSGRTGQKFTDIFTEDDILTVVKGFGEGISVANCMYISNEYPKDIKELFNRLQEITHESVKKATDEFKVVYRPVNPMTEESNRAKNVYTQFVPKNKLDNLTKITTAKELFKLGEFMIVEPKCINHNHILKSLKEKYNIEIPVKKKTNKKSKK